MAASAPPTTSPPQLAGHRPWRRPRRPDCPRLVTEWWESDPSHLMGIEIAADVKAGTGRYRPLIEPLSCRNCRANGKRARMILAVYAGPDGLVWLWTAGYRGLRNHPGETDQTIHTERIPPSARQVTVGFGSVAVCANCRHGQPFFVQSNGSNTAFINTNFDPAPPTFGRVTE